MRISAYQNTLSIEAVQLLLAAGHGVKGRQSVFAIAYEALTADQHVAADFQFAAARQRRHRR